MDYKELVPFIDYFGTEITKYNITQGAMNLSGEITTTETSEPVKVALQKYNKETHGIVNNIKDEPSFVIYSYNEIKNTDEFEIDGKRFVVVSVDIQRIQGSFLYYKAYLVKK